MKALLAVAAILIVVIIGLMMVIYYQGQEKQCVEDRPTWINRTDYLIPNIIWLICALGFLMHGPKIIGITFEGNGD